MYFLIIDIFLKLIFKSILTFSKLGRKAHEHYLLKNVGGDRNRWNERDKEDGIE